MYDVITIGSALIDIFIHSDHFVSQASEKGQMLCQLYGDKVDIESFKVCTGGGATNVAVGLSRLGFQAAVISETGRDDFAQIVFNDLKREKVSTNLMINEKLEQTGGSIILVGNDGGRTVLVHRGASSQLDPYDISPFWVSKTKWLHLSSIAGRRETLQKIFRLVQRTPEVNLSWNPGKGELKLLAEGKIQVQDIPCRVMFVNKQEWAMIEQFHKKILTHISQVVVTDGKNEGSVFVEGKQEFKYPVKAIQSLDDTGAGDAFATGYVAAQLLNLSPRDSIAWGLKNASSVILHYGAKMGLLRRDDFI